MRYGITVCVLIFLIQVMGGSLHADSISDATASAKQIHRSVLELRKRYLNVHGYRGAHYAEERLVDGMNHYDLEDYHRASIILLDIIENYEGHAAWPEALYYYADSLFLSRDYYGARTEFQRLLNQKETSAFLPFRPAAISRLVEVAVHLDDFRHVKQYIQLLQDRTDGRSQYIKGKYHYFQEEYDQALREFGAVRDDEELVLKAAYFMGATHVKQGTLDDAIAAFQKGVGAFPEVRPSNRKLLDLLYLGLGRVQFEKDDLENAISSYDKIDQYSPYYDVALYESAAVHMRAGNTIGAERILEVLTLAIPDSRYIPRAKLLRGQLLSSAGRYDEAETVFNQTIEEFSPVEKMMDRALAQSGDSGEFFELLMARSVDALDVESMIPREVVMWAGEEPEVKRAFVLTDDLAKARTYTAESDRLAELISAVVNATDPVNAIPELRNAMRMNVLYRNQLAALTMPLLVSLENAVGYEQIADLAASRTELAGNVNALPVDDNTVRERERQAKQKYTELRQTLSRYDTMLDKLQAVITGLEHYIGKPEYRSEVPPQVIASHESQLARYIATVDAIREEVASVRLDIEKATYQIGYGSEQDRADSAVVARLTVLVEKYLKFVPGAGRKAERFRGALTALVNALDEIERLNGDIEQVATVEVSRIRRVLQQEQAKLRQYRAQLNALNGEAKEVVNGVARENFSGIRKRFGELMVKADVGIIDIAWMRKEQHKSRAVQLSRNRTNELEWLDEEFKEADGFSSVTEADAAQ